MQIRHPLTGAALSEVLRESATTPITVNFLPWVPDFSVKRILCLVECFGRAFGQNHAVQIPVALFKETSAISFSRMPSKYPGLTIAD